REHYLVAKYAPEHTITIYSFSKIFGMAGLRIGGIIATPDMLNSVRSILINDLGTNVISQVGAIAALKSKHQWINDIKKQTRKNQDIIKKAVDQIEGVFLPVYPSDGNMIAIDLKETGIDPQVMANYLCDKKIFIRQGSYTSKLFGDRYIRISFSVPEYQVKIFAEKFVEACDSLRPL
ncbi:MAG: aminotransferase class I/II-fold pyridoxal phosphate-dependent enzyme, partial [Euryarchaeota archaeon]|nr:aminotransferase class I/II-fold pyridoxal phosphate-dependent enzyme [Euryarchaeota archaeon]MBV1767619.1 aminotransferase class I/II-fold pyridoxal phosphate-dependent enzyme [Methanobacterium sp.]